MRVNQERLKFWTDKIKTWEKNNLSQAEYCRQNKLDEQLFSKWKRRLLKVKDNKENRLVKIPVKLNPTFLKNQPIELIINGHYTIKVHSGFNPGTLKEIIQAIENTQ